MDEATRSRARKLTPVVHFIINAVVLVSVLVVVWELGHLYFGPMVLNVRPRGIQEGAQLRWPGIKWDSGKESLVLVLKDGCHYCESNADFYRTLIRRVTAKPIEVIAVLPNRPPVARAYLRSLGLRVSEVRRVAFEQMGISGAPALVLVSPVGRVQASWLGSLSFAEQEGVFHVLQKELGVYRSPGLPQWSQVSPAALRDFVLSGKHVQIVDIRPRADYSKGHIVGAVNIPFDELYVRAPHEVSGSSPIFVYCHWCSGCEAEKAAEGISTVCSFSITLLRRMHYTSIRMIDADLSTLRKAGVKVVGTSEE